MKNVDIKEDKGKLIITVDLKKEFGLSASQKNIIIASTEGNQVVNGVTVGLNVYKKK